MSTIFDRRVELKDLQLRSQPELFERPDGHRSARFQTFEDWVTDFAARTGKWPGGPDYQSAGTLEDDVVTNLLRIHLQQVAAPLPEEIEFSDDGKFVEAGRVIVALRRRMDRIVDFIQWGILPPVYVNSENRFVWKFDDIENLLLLAERTTEIYEEPFRDEGDISNRQMIWVPPDPALSERGVKQKFIEANLPVLTDWQIETIYSFIWEGPHAELSRVPFKAPRLWSERSDAERSRGKGFLNPAQFIRSVWGPWLSTGILSEDHLLDRDPDLLAAYKEWLYRHKEDRVVELKPGQSDLEKRVYGITAATPWEEIEKIALAVAKKRQRRLQAKPKLS